MISLVYAQSKNGIIGRKGKLPWHLPADMHHFVKVTTGHAILAGYKTFKSFPKPLPHRINIVLTHHKQKEFPKNVIVIHNPLILLRFVQSKKLKQELCVVGGASIYRMFMPYADIIHQTVIYHHFKGDTKAPKINFRDFKLVKTERHNKSEKNKYNFSFNLWKRVTI